MSNQFAIYDVLDLTFQDYNTAGYGGNIKFFSDLANSVEIAVTGERQHIRAGSGNYIAYSFDHTKAGTATISLPIIDLNALSMLTGKSISTGAKQYPVRERLQANASNQVTLTNTPVGTSDGVAGSLKVYVESGRIDHSEELTIATVVAGASAGKYTYAANVLTFDNSDVAEDAWVIVYYDTTSAVTAQTITVTADDMPTNMRIFGSGTWVDQYTGSEVDVSFDIKKCKCQPGWSYSLQSDGSNPTTLELVFDMYPVDNAAGTDKIFFETVVLT